MWKKNLLFGIIWVLFVMVIVWIMFFTGEKKTTENVVEDSSVGISKKQDLSFYKKMWEDTFLNYQNTVTNLKNEGNFKFEVMMQVEWDNKKLLKVINKSSKIWKFSSFRVLFEWTYDFTDVESIKVDANLQVDLNKDQFSVWDIDITFEIKWDGTLEYTINNLNRTVLKFLWIDKDQINVMMDVYEENIVLLDDFNKPLKLKIPNKLWTEIISSIKAKSSDSPLYKNSKEEEDKIIKAFLSNDVIQIISWKPKGDMNIIDFVFNPENWINFLNDVAKAIAKWNDVKNFDWEKTYFKDLTINWSFTIRDNLIIDSNIWTELPIKWISKKTWKETIDIIILKTQFRMFSPSAIDFDLINTIVAKSSPKNKLKVLIKGFIK